MTKPLYHLGRFCVRHHRVVFVAWLALVIALAAVAKSVGTVTSNNLTLPGTDSTKAQDLLDRYLPAQENGTNPIVLRSRQGGKLTQGKNEQGVKKAVNSLEHTHYVRSAVSPLSQAGASALSKNEEVGYISVTLTLGPSDLEEDQASKVIDGADPARDAGLEVQTGGYLGQAVSKPSTESSEVIGIGMAIIVLLFTFGTAVAMAMPITSAILGLIAGLSAIGLLGHVVDVPSVGPILGTMLGLGVGIDYALFIVTRHRAGYASGLDVNESVARAVAISGGAVAFAGSTVILALLSLVLAGIPIVSALGYSAAVMVLVAMIAALTLLPSVLALVGPRIESLKVPFHEAKAQDDRPHGWKRWSEGVARRPWPATVGAVAILLVLAIPVLDLELGQQDNGQFSKSTTLRKSYDLLKANFAPGVNGPLLIAVRMHPPAHNDQKRLNQLNSQEQKQQQSIGQLEAEGETQSEAEQQAGVTSKSQQQEQQQKQFLESTASDPTLTSLEKQVGKTKGVASTSEADVSKHGQAAVFTAISKTAPSADSTEQVVHKLRDDVIPNNLKGTKTKAYVGGQTAGFIDLADRISDKLLSVIVIVVLLAFILLTFAFRAFIIALTAGLMNLLSVAASYGVLTAVFQWGWGVELLGLDHKTPIVSYVPLIMFAILFGLSMDYQVFLLSRVRERYLATHDNQHSVVDGLAVSARVITSAALIMVAVFGSFILNGDPTVKEFGVGLAVAIALDATVVRCLLVPAVMVLLGRSNWWFPSWAAKMPELGIEGEEFFKARGFVVPAGGPKSKV
jgi:putative drug exporter of the RND superfamily